MDALLRPRIGIARIRFAMIAAVAVVTLSGCSPATDGHRTSTAVETPSATVPVSIDLSEPLQHLEQAHAARIGVSAVDTGTGRTVSYRADDRFGYASSIKVFIAAGFLSTVPPSERDTVVTWTQDDVDAAGYSPVTSQHVDDGLTLSRVAEAAVRTSDNTAANLILTRIGGPAGLQDFLRRAGDTASEVVSYEPDLNVIEPGSTDDTTTPAAFAADLRVFLTGTALADDDRATLVDWMSGNATGDTLIRAGAPDGWAVADKSGGAYGIRNDIAIVTPPGRAPIILAILTTKHAADEAYDDSTVADTARVVLEALR